MKNFLFLLIASVLVFFAIFAVCYWLFSADMGTAIIIASSGAVAGLLVEVFQGYNQRNRKDREMRKLERRSEE